MHGPINIKFSPYRPSVAQRVGRGIALLFHDRGTRRGWVVSSTPRPHFTPGKDPVPIVQEVGWAPRPVWTGGKARPHRDSIPDRPARSQSLYRLSYPSHIMPPTLKNLFFPLTLYWERVNVSAYIENLLHVWDTKLYMCYRVRREAKKVKDCFTDSESAK